MLKNIIFTMAPHNEDNGGHQEPLLERYNQFDKFNPDLGTPAYEQYVSTLHDFLNLIEQLNPDISILIFFLTIYRKMKADEVYICPRNSSTFGIILEILTKNIDNLPNDHGVDEMSAEDADYISHRGGCTFATNTETGEAYNVRDFYNHFHELYPEDCSPL
jgi:hypothetical protein